MSAAQMATWEAVTKRRPAIATDGRVGSPTPYLTGVQIVPLLPVTAEVANMHHIETPRETKLTYVFAEQNSDRLPDVAEGDILVVRGAEYIVRSAAEWQRDGESDFLEIVVEEQKIT